MELYHLSQTPHIEVLVPLIPKCAIPMYEDTSIRRVCFSNSISGCLSALQDIAGAEFYVYTPIEECDIIVPEPELVNDAHLTGEVWCLDRVKVICIGKIIITNESDHIIDNKSDIGKYRMRINRPLYYIKYDYEWIERFDDINKF